MSHEYLNGLAHVCVSADGDEAFDKAIRFYTETLGFTIGRQWKNRAGNRRAMLATGTGEIELNSDGTSKAHGVINHFCLACTDVDAFIEQMRTAGRKIVVEPMTVGANEDPPQSIREAMFEGPCGELIQLQCVNYRQ